MKTWLLLLLLGCLAWADPITVTLHSEPEGATIYDYTGNAVGQTGKPCRLDGKTTELTLILEGYRPEPVYVPVNKLTALQGKIFRLEPKSRWTALAYWCKTHPAELSVAGLAALGLAILARRRQSLVQRQLQRASLMKEGGPEDSLLMETVGRYLLTEVVGKGGMATVYRGVPADTLDKSQSVAVKVIRAPDAQEWERFRREIDICRNLRHAHIVTLLDYGHHQQMLYLVLELIEGPTLREVLRDRQLPAAEAWSILEPLLGAVAYAHQNGVVHRDLKPENIMFSPKLKVMDFGLAKSTDSQKLTATGTIMGTPLYMAPEQIEGGNLHPATDQYALGAMIFEILSGRPPFQDPDVVQLIYSHLQTAPPRLSDFRPDLAGLDEVLYQMMAKDPARRYPSLVEASEQLRLHLQS
ncbi:MAG: protein kinase [Candidatus Eremiobacteraeota bacterium]|nr:protein kinase [Candidatus Eremiobacteraeota bacterium]MCW5871501.1 protein kinase [Candidatus Eremiobacteraeota bacterium]